MATVVATFTDVGEAERAAAQLRASGLGEVTVGVTDGGPGSVIGLGATMDGFRNGVIGVSTLGGAATLGGVGAFLGMLYAGFVENRNMGTVEYLPNALSVLVLWALVGLVIGIVAGLGAGVAMAGLLGAAVEDSVRRGQGTRRPQLLVRAPDAAAEDLAIAILKDFSVFELGRQATPPAPARALAR